MPPGEQLDPILRQRVLNPVHRRCRLALGIQIQGRGGDAMGGGDVLGRQGAPMVANFPFAAKAPEIGTGTPIFNASPAAMAREIRPGAGQCGGSQGGSGQKAGDG